jgi:hypothetical protein
MTIVDSITLDIQSNDPEVEKLRVLYAGAKKDLKQFKVNLEENPLYAFEWAASAIKAAAMIDVVLNFASRLDHHGYLTEPITRTLTIEAVMRWLKSELLRAATGAGPSRHNVNEEYIAALATVYEKMEERNWIPKAK